MKINDIMIGDWVNFLIDVEGGDTEYDGATAYYQPLQITTIAAWGAGNDGEVASDEGVVNDPDQLQPIPLTPEILKKNGFELQRDKSELGILDTYWLGSELGTFRIHRLNNRDYQFGLAKIRNVHELQHALRLCRIEKEIKL